MSAGYVYVLSNPAMPGLVKIGRTDRPPELRTRELHSTGVPQPFALEHYVAVDDSAAAERHIHALLQARGRRPAADREFFQLSVGEAIEILSLVASTPGRGPDFTRLTELAALAAAVALPSRGADFDTVDAASGRLAALARRGYPRAMRQASDLFEHVCPHGPRFKDLYREFLSLARAHASWVPLASSGGREVRAEVGRDVAQYLAICSRRGWITEDDYTFASAFLVEGDQFQYEGYVDELGRYDLPGDVATRAAGL